MSSGATMPARAPASIDMLQMVIRLSIEKPRITSPAYSRTCPAPPDTPSRPIAPRMTSLAVRPVGSSPVEQDAHCSRLHLRQALRRKYVLDLGRSDTERQRAERAMRGGMRVSTDDREPRLRQPELRPDHVNDPFSAAPGCVERHAELRAVSLERFELRLRKRVGRPRAGGDVVIHRRKRQVWAADPATGESKPLEGLRRGDLVHEMQVDPEQSGLARRLGHQAAFPHAVEEGLRHAPIVAVGTAARVEDAMR